MIEIKSFHVAAAETEGDFSKTLKPIIVNTRSFARIGISLRQLLPPAGRFREHNLMT